MHNMETRPGYSHCTQEHNDTNLVQQHHAEDTGALAQGNKQLQQLLHAKH